MQQIELNLGVESSIARPQTLQGTIINDVAPEALASKSSSEPEASLHYTHVKSSPPPADTPGSQKSPLVTFATRYNSSVEDSRQNQQEDERPELVQVTSFMWNNFFFHFFCTADLKTKITFLFNFL